MKVEQSLIKKLKITDVQGLDAVTVFLEDLGVSAGKITIECFGKSWSSYWGGMGDRAVSEFFVGCNESYLANNLSPAIESTEPDYDAVEAMIKAQILGRRRLNLIESDSARELYNIYDWEQYAPSHPYDSWKCPDYITDEDFEYLALDDIEVPDKPHPDYVYLCRIIKAVQAALKEL